MSPPFIFDRPLLRRRRGRAARALAAEYLFDETFERLMERLQEVRKPFSRMLCIGARANRLNVPDAHILYADFSEIMARHQPTPSVVMDEESICFAPETFDAIICLGALHMVNDLVGCFIQLRQCLKPDGLLLCVMPGGNTLPELRAAILSAEDAQNRGSSPFIAPLVEVRDLGNVLQRAGFSLPVIDRDIIRVEYQTLATLLHDLRAMGETNTLHARHKKPLPRDFWNEVERHYRAQFSTLSNALPAQFELIFAAAWKPDPSQPKALPRGSGTFSLNDFFTKD